MNIYKTRPIRFIQVAEKNDWRLKVYSISSKNGIVPQELIDSIWGAFDLLPSPAISDTRYGIGCLILHEGNDGNYIVLNWWTGENMIASKILHSQGNGIYHPIQEDIISCVWELEVLYFEKRSWTDNILKHGLNEENILKYLKDTLNTEV